jgi:hypothetical protein
MAPPPRTSQPPPHHHPLRSTTKPHAACRRLKITDAPREKPLWNLTLLFSTKEQCADAQTHLETSRVRPCSLLSPPRSALFSLRTAAFMFAWCAWCAACAYNDSNTLRTHTHTHTHIHTYTHTHTLQDRLRPRTVAALLQHLPQADLEPGEIEAAAESS